MKNENDKAPAFPVPKEVKTSYSSLDSPQRDYSGLTKREFIATHFASQMILREKTPASFRDFLKHQLNKLGGNYEVNYRLNIDARCTAQQAAIHADTLLDQLECNRLNNLN